MADTIDGTIQTMRQQHPISLVDGQIWRSREDQEPTRESIFAWDRTVYDGPLYDNAGTFEVPQYVGFAPLVDPDASHTGVWRWIDPPSGSIDAERVYGVSAKEAAIVNGRQFQRCIDEVLASDQTWPRASNDPGEGDSWIVHLPAGTIELDPRDGNNVSIPITFNRKTPDTEGCDPGEEKITVAGRIILKGQGLTTRLSHIGDPGQDAFKVGGSPSEIWTPGCVFRHLGRFDLHDLELQGATHAGFSVLRIQQASGTNKFENVKITQYGNGDGVNANEIVFNRFSQFTVQRLKDTARYPNPLQSSGRGFWVHTDDYPYYISGQLVLDRLSVFGQPHDDPAQYHFFDTGILLGGNQDPNRLLGSVSGQFINAELCQDGIVFGKGAVNVDFSVVWVESNQKAGVRFIDGPKNITLRQVYTFQSAPRVPPTFEGDIVFGKKGGTAAENSYSAITLDGIYQNFLYGPAVRLFPAEDADLRDIRIRNIFVGFPLESGLFADQLFGGGRSEFYDGSAGTIPPGTVIPIAEAIVQLDSGTYDGLVVESVQPWAGDAGLPLNVNDDYVQIINKPELVDRLVFSGPYDGQFAFGVYEMQGPTVARRGLTHTASYTIRHNDPMYHRVDTTDSGLVIITLPRITQQSAMMPIDREGLEFHVMWIGLFGTQRALSGQYVPEGDYTEKIHGRPAPNGTISVFPTATYAYIRVRAVSEPGGVPHWEIVDYDRIS